MTSFPFIFGRFFDDRGWSFGIYLNLLLGILVVVFPCLWLIALILVVVIGKRKGLELLGIGHEGLELPANLHHRCATKRNSPASPYSPANLHHRCATKRSPYSPANLHHRCSTKTKSLSSKTVAHRILGRNVAHSLI